MADLDSLILSRHSWSVGRSIVLVGWYAVGMYLIRVLKGACLVVAFSHKFLTYCAKGRSFDHLCCWLSQYSCRYVSRDWFMHSDCPSV
jgi:hypothetical protein